MNWYNEINPYAAEWLRNLIHRGHIAPGVVDERSIKDVHPDELNQYTQCHFFAGIGGWSKALRLAQFPDDRPIWTGSCPCQPFSTAGKRKGKEDDRHLFPFWLRLIRECKPATIFGEQVAAAVSSGWLDEVYQGLEAEGYTVGSSVLPAVAVGAPHRRERIYFVAHKSTVGHSEYDGSFTGAFPGGYDPAVQEGTTREVYTGQPEGAGSCYSIPISFGEDNWDGAEWHSCGDGKERPTQPGIPLLAHGVSGQCMVELCPTQEGSTETEEEHWYSRAGAIEGIGNAIVPPLAAGFVLSALEAIRESSKVE